MEEYNIILLGKPGAGKGTVATKLSKNFGLVHISTGDILRRDKYKTIFHEQTQKGELISDEEMVEILRTEIELLKQEKKNIGIILDGFPRTEKQSLIIDKIINTEKTVAIDLQVSDEETRKRISSRVTNAGSNARKDDLNNNAIQQRINKYNTQNQQIKKHLKTKGIRCLNINANYDQNQVQKIVEQALQTFLNEQSLTF